MPFPTTGSSSELQAVNQILASVGQAPVTTLTTEETFVINEVDRFVGFLASTYLFAKTSSIPVGTYIGGTGVTTNTSTATTSVVFTPSASIGADATKLISTSPYIPKGVLVSSDNITTPVKVTSGPTASGSNWEYNITLTNGDPNTTTNAPNADLTLDPIYYQYTTNISQTVFSPDDQKTLTQSNVTSRVETQTNPDVAIALNTLREVSREVQSEGWSFNKEYDYPITPDSNNEVRIANNILQMDLNRNQRVENIDRESVNRGGKLYDKKAHSYKWTDETLYVDITWYLDWDVVPQPIQAYIVARAAGIVSSRIIGDPNQYQMLQQKEAYARAMAMEYECNQEDVSFFGSPKSGNYYQPYQPFHTLHR
jgi:hypothetical protein